MKKLLFILVLGLTFMASKCEDDSNPQGQIDMNFKASFGTEPLVMFADDYPYEDGMDVKFQLFQFYISEITLLKDLNDGTGTEILDVELVSFKDIQDAAAAEQGIDITIADIPPGEYQGIRIGLGVDPDLNKTNTGDYTPGHPLSDHYWSAALGYVFTKIEGNADLEGNGDFQEKLTFHIGTDPYFRSKTFTKPMTIEAGGIADLNFTIDLRDILVDSDGEYLDFRTTPQDHTNDADVAAFISDNLKEALKLE